MLLDKHLRSELFVVGFFYKSWEKSTDLPCIAQDLTLQKILQPFKIVHTSKIYVAAPSITTSLTYPE